MDRVFAAHSASPRTGIEMNVWHSLLLRSPLNREQRPGEVPDERTVGKWQQLQASAALRFRPKIITWEDYGDIAFPSWNEKQKFYGGRGWAMNVNARLAEPSLKLYDPMISDASTKVIGGSPGPHVSYTPAGRCDAFDPRLGGDSAHLTYDAGIFYPNPPKAPILSGGAGSISLWIRPTLGASAASPGFLATACRRLDGPDCLVLAVQPDDRLSLSLTDATGRGTTVSADIASWRRPAGMPDWHQVAATWDSRQRRLGLYIDGHMETAAPAEWTPFPLWDKLVIGNPTPGGNSGAVADVAEVRVYSAPLDARQILREYQAYLHKGMRDAQARSQCPALR